MKNKYFLEKLSTYLFYASVLIFLVAFNFQDSKTGGWVQQFLPTLPGSPTIKDISFADSSVGYALAMNVGYQDTSYILKTTNGGSNWFIQRMITSEFSGLNRLFILNTDTLFIASYIGTAGNIGYMIRTTNGGINWQSYSWPTTAEPSDLFVLNLDTIWMCGPSGSSGGLFRTTNGGLNWQLQYVGISTSNPNKIYMYNARIGFMSAGTAILKTTNSGDNWFSVSTNDYFYDIYFADSLKGFNSNPDRPYSFNKTTNGGLNWQSVPLPYVAGTSNTYRYIRNFSYINDTIYGVYGLVRYNSQYRAIIYRTTNGGLNWGYQIPDTSYNIFRLLFTKFVTGKKGWCYREYDGITTYTGGDTTIMAGINSISNIVPKDYVLYQNYPNPFNSMTNVKVQMSKQGFAEIKIFDLTGRLIKTIINKKLSSGEHIFKFDASDFTSGVYFYTLFVDGVRIDMKKAVLIK